MGPCPSAEELVWWRLAVTAPTSATVPADAATREEGPDGALDPVVAARAERDVFMAETVRHALSQHEGTQAEDARLTHALIDGLGVGVVLGRLTPSEAVGILGHHLGIHSEGG